MKKRIVLSAAVAAFAMGALAPAFAQPTDPVRPAYPVERIYVPGERVHGALHGGWVAPGDEELLDRTLAPLASKRELNSTATVVAKNGEIIMNGTTENYEQSQRMAKLAKDASNGRATTWFSEM